jgi:hypothetical protein
MAEFSFCPRSAVGVPILKWALGGSPTELAAASRWLPALLLEVAAGRFLLLPLLSSVVPGLSGAPGDKRLVAALYHLLLYSTAWPEHAE